VVHYILPVGPSPLLIVVKVEFELRSTTTVAFSLLTSSAKLYYMDHTLELIIQCFSRDLILEGEKMEKLLVLGGNL